MKFDQHTVTWNPYLSYWGRVTVTFRLGERLVVWVTPTMFEPCKIAHYPPCPGNTTECNCRVWGSGDDFRTEEEALLWLYSDEDIHWKRARLSKSLPLPAASLGNKRRKRTRQQERARDVWWDLKEDLRFKPLKALT